MKLSYWCGDKIRLRAPKSEDIHMFEHLDGDILKNLDSIAFPRTNQQIEEWINEISKGASTESDDFYWIAEDTSNNVGGQLRFLDVMQKMGPLIMR